MYARKDIPTVLPDAVLRCRKLEAVAKVELDEMEKANIRRLNTLQWQQQSFQRTLNERHKRWRVYDRAFRLKLKRELGTDLAAQLRLRTIQDEEQKYLLEQQLIEQSFANPRKDDEMKPASMTKKIPKWLTDWPNKASSFIESDPTTNQFAVNARRVQSAATPVSHATPAPSHATPAPTRATLAPTHAMKLPTQRPRTSRFDTQIERDTDAFNGLKDDFGSVLFRILSNIAATPDLDDDFTIRKRALEARERRLIHTKDDRYYNLVKELVPQKAPGEIADDDDDDIVEEEDQ